MTDKEYRREAKRIHRLIKLWKTRLYLCELDISVEVHRDALSNDRGWSNWRVNATTDAHWQYCTAYIRFSAMATISLSDEDLAITVIHELLHVALSETRTEEYDEEAAGHEERVVTRLSRSIYELGKRGNNAAKRSTALDTPTAVGSTTIGGEETDYREGQGNTATVRRGVGGVTAVVG